MAYTVNKTNSSASPNQYTVQDGVINTQTDLSLIGKGYAGYGESIAENFLHLLENFSNSSAPSKPITGQLWWDTAEARLLLAIHPIGACIIGYLQPNISVILFISFHQ